MERRQRTPERTILQQLLREVRVQAGLNQEDLAERLGVPQSFVSRFESGRRHLDVLELRTICQICNVTLASFLERLEARLDDLDV